MSPLALSIRFLQTQPDRKLLELAQAGHERAFEALVQRYRRPLLNYCRRITGSDAAAEDALQQGLLQAWVALSGRDIEVREARAWLYRIVHNVAVSNLRRPVHDSVDVEHADDAGGPDHEVERRLAVRQALAGLASLPELQRQVMLSAALEGRSHNEIAAALGLSHGAVRGLIYRARATLRAAAAALTPSPLVHWAARQELAAGGRSAGIYEAIAGAGSAGVGGLLIKGGAVVVAAGALATAAVTTTGGDHRHRVHRDASSVAAHAARPVGAGAASGGAQRAIAGMELTALTGRGAAASLRSGRGEAGRRGASPAWRGRHGGPGSSERVSAVTPSGGHRSPGGSGSSPSRGGGSGGGSSGGSSGHDRAGGSDGGSNHGSTSGSGGGDHGDGGHDGAVASLAPTTTTSSSSGDGSFSGSGSGDHHDGGSGSGSGDGGGSGGTATTTTTVTATTSTSGGGGGE
jgi:RNA polymerase sigma factor (sigma-70 family)